MLKNDTLVPLLLHFSIQTTVPFYTHLFNPYAADAKTWKMTETLAHG